MNRALLFLATVLGATALSADDKSTASPSPQIVIARDVHSQTAANIGTAKTVPYKAGLTVLKAIAAIGGYGDFGGARLYLIRNSKVQKLDLVEMLKDSQKDVGLQAWDIIYIY
jgi:protein involved in polysaccharide export with SLBB domain